MRLYYIFLLLSVAYLTSQVVDAQGADFLCPTNNVTIVTYALDEETLKALQKEIGILNSSNRILKSRLETITARLDQQTEVFNNLSAKLYVEENLQKCSPNAPLFDLRYGFSNEFTFSNCLRKQRYPCNCAEATASKRSSGIFTIQLDTLGSKSFLAVCDEETQGGGWTVIQRRMDGSIDFFRDWNSYKIGFGNLETEFFIGLDKLHALTTEVPQELLIVMRDFEGATKYAKYSSFAIGDETEDYALKVLGKYSGDAGDSLTFHSGFKFTTKDKKNDIYADGNCALKFSGAWWYSKCHSSNLNGLYLKGKVGENRYAQGVDWSEWRGHYYSLKDVKMMIRPRRT